MKSTKRKIAFGMVCVLLVMVLGVHPFVQADVQSDNGENILLAEASATPPTSSATVTPSQEPTASSTVTPSQEPTETPSGTPTVSETPATIPTGSAIVDPTPEPSRQPVTVKKKVTVILGKSIAIKQIISDPDAFEKMTLPKAKKYHKYFSINNEKKKIVTKKNYSVKIQKKIRVNVWVRGEEEPYSVLVKIKIPKPKVKIKVERYTNPGIYGYDFYFHYKLVKGSRLKVRLAKGGTAEINRYFDKYISGRKSNKASHIRITGRSIRKNGNKLSFKIFAYFGKGKNKSQTVKITKKVK